MKMTLAKRQTAARQKARRNSKQKKKKKRQSVRMGILENTQNHS